MKLKERLRGIIPDDQLNHLSNRIQIIGDAAIVSVPHEMKMYEKDIAKAILLGHTGLKTVLNKVSKLEGDRRVAHFEILAGNETVTLYREFGFCYRFDVQEVFFNSHLSYERRRIAASVRAKEEVLIPFCGVGPFVVPAASAGARVLAIESNSEACKWLAENIRLNRVEKNIDLIKGDAFLAPNLLKIKDRRFDRAIIPTPYGKDQILDIISPLIKKGGAIHFYTFKKKRQIDGLIEGYENSGFIVEFFRRCGNVAPGVSRWVFDLIKC